MVTNGGYGGVQFALAHGVPLVVAGDHEDKPETAARVAGSGVGRNLKTGRPTPRGDSGGRNRRARPTVVPRCSPATLAAQVRGTDAVATIVSGLTEAETRTHQP